MLDKKTEAMLQAANALTADDLDCLRNAGAVATVEPADEESEEAAPTAQEDTGATGGGTSRATMAHLRPRIPSPSQPAGRPRSPTSAATATAGEYERRRASPESLHDLPRASRAKDTTGGHSARTSSAASARSSPRSWSRTHKSKAVEAFNPAPRSRRQSVRHTHARGHRSYRSLSPSPQPGPRRRHHKRLGLLATKSLKRPY